MRAPAPPSAQKLLSPLTDLEDATPEREPLMVLAQLSVCALGGTWAGLLSLGSEPHGLRALLKVPRVCHSAQSHLILDALAALLRLPHLKRVPFAPTSLSAGASRPPPGRARAASTDRPLPSRRPCADVLQAYRAVVLQVLLHCGLLDMLEAAGRSVERQLATGSNR